MSDTRFILAGGNDRATKQYWQELAKATPHTKPLHVLSCMFARDDTRWEKLFEEFREFFKIAFGNDVVLELASQDRLSEQIKAADVVYLHGGSDGEELKRTLLAVPGLQQQFEDKIVIGSSAGAQFLSTKFWSVGKREVREGAGLTPLNIIVHYGSDFGSDDPRGPIDWQRAEQELQKGIGDENVTRLLEGKFVVYEL